MRPLARNRAWHVKGPLPRRRGWLEGLPLWKWKRGDSGMAGMSWELSHMPQIDAWKSGVYVANQHRHHWHPEGGLEQLAWARASDETDAVGNSSLNAAEC